MCVPQSQNPGSLQKQFADHGLRLVTCHTWDSSEPALPGGWAMATE